jgi:hypothetical protein
MVNDNFFPKTIQQVVLGDNQKPEIIEVPFELANWINPNLLNEFGLETVTQALTNLQYSFRELREIKSVTSKGFQLLEYYPINSYWFNNSESKQAKDGNHWKTVRTEKYVFYVLGNLKFGEVFRECLFLQNHLLREFNTKKEILFDVEKFLNESVNLMKDIPAELRDLTLNEIAALPSPYRITVNSPKLKCYSPHTKFENYEFYFELEKETGRKINSLYIPFQAYKLKDFSLVEKRMKDYFKFYYHYEKLAQENLDEILNHPLTKKFRQLVFEN